MEWVYIDAAKLRGVMYLAGFTGKSLSELTGISRVEISAICNGKRCRSKKAELIAEALRTPLEDLLEKR